MSKLVNVPIFMGEFRFAQGELGCAQRGVSHCVLEGSLNSPSVRFDEGASAETKSTLSLPSEEEKGGKAPNECPKGGGSDANKHKKFHH
jgi:hypothetical protein